MAGLLDKVLDAHGGLDRWNALATVEATVVSGGKLWEIKGQPQDATPRRMAVATQRSWASVRPFGAPDQRTDFTAARIAIEKLDGRVVAERRNPRESFTGHELATPWDPLQRAYFNGYALWTYLNTPFLMALPGLRVSEIDPVEDHGRQLAGLRVEFPAEFPSHSAVQEFYVNEQYLVCRHDYRVDVAGGFAAIQYIDGAVDFDGFTMPTKRKAYRADTDNRVITKDLMVSIDLSEFAFRTGDG
ncbi:hypothetical protein ORI20_27200 [Mycobacterium sp. CVI_P3]|uniref:Uncharacterized protein n=1 Tax=Mycobacterium pinniadriaticum TaxID=2994102 RepID=A0ABT3SLI6_9MYCO|nr:hypothetical protein [Mycobacterium pinniadriaticum]MCX2933962.1 hypothetical protein [Mycobacterium pinniadriaticum]MCX2940384.1 hypothetical protein [Mycobacterium pinniadriaticum]